MIIRIKKNETPYIVLDVTALRDKSLSAQAKGVHTYLMTLPDSWTVRMTEVVNHFSDGYAAISSAFNELIEHGYVTKVRANANGKGDWKISVFETPQTDDMIYNLSVIEEAKRKASKKSTPTKKGISIDELLELMPEKFQHKKMWEQWLEHRSSIGSPFTPIAAKCLRDKVIGCTREQLEAAISESIIKGWVGVFPRKDCPSSAPAETLTLPKSSSPTLTSMEERLVKIIGSYVTEDITIAVKLTAAKKIIHYASLLPGDWNNPDTVKGHYRSIPQFCHSLFENVPPYIVLHKTESRLTQFQNDQERKLGVSLRTGRAI